MITLPNVPWDELVRRWRLLEKLGVETIWLADHLANPYRTEQEWLEAWTCLGALAVGTERVRLGPLVSPITFRNPAVLAKAAVTLDHVSGGRVELGVGAGGSGFDHELAGVERWVGGERTRRLEAFVERLVALLARPDLAPRPVQASLPITIGGQSPTALCLAARHAARWNTIPERGLSLEEQALRTRERNLRLDELCAAEGREPASLVRSLILWPLAVPETPWRSPEAFRETVERWRAAGIEELVVYYPPETGMPAGSVEPGLFERVVGGARPVDV